MRNGADAPQAPASRFGGLTHLLAPASVAVLGASADPTRIGGRPIAYMLARRFKGAILPINPNRTEVQGLRAYGSVAALPETPDVAIVAVPVEAAIGAVDDLGARGVKAAALAETACRNAPLAVAKASPTPVRPST
jgi:acetate---CoA ligase (ADP-forming)